MPILTMNDIWFKSWYVHQTFQSSTRKKSKSLCIIEFPINTRTRKIIFIIDKIIMNPLINHRVQTAILLTPSDWDTKMSQMFHLFLKVLSNGTVLRHNNAYIYALFMQEGR